jgi:crotonobetainyl-CoA:carnitine CoA-transferase CaiB-like acyl-CoA transferase
MVAAMARPESQSQKHTLYNGLIVDKTTAMTASQAILAALYARDVRGKGGQHIELSMYDVGFAFNWVDIFADHYFAGEGITHEPSDNPLLSHRIKDPE